MGHGLDSSGSLGQDANEGRGYEKLASNENTVTSPPSGVIGSEIGWSGARPSVVKHQQPYQPSTRSLSSRYADSNKLLGVFTVIGLIFIVSNFSKMSGVGAMPRCPPIGIENEEPADCLYGITTDYCGRKVCVKGPGQICGVGIFKLLGTCGEGLYCNCGRCTGCSLTTLTCFDKTCI